MTIKHYELVGRDPNRPFSPHCWKSRLALGHKGLAFETVPVRFTEIPEIENGGQKTVPVIRHGENVIAGSFEIALYLRESYPDHSGHLFRGEGAIALTRFVESWTNTQLHPWIMKWAAVDIHDMLDEKDQAYFRESREKRFGVTLEQLSEGREDSAGQLTRILAPLHLLLKQQPHIGGKGPAYADFIVFGAFQWLRVVSGWAMIAADDPVRPWLEAMLDLNGGDARSVPEAGA